MNRETSPAIRGTILKVPDTTPGLLFLMGEQRPFTLERVWKSPTAPAVNTAVDVELDSAGAITSITLVDSKQMSKEQLSQLGAVAQERGKEAAKLAQQGVGALAARMGKVALGIGVLVWVAWFFLPAASVSGGPVGSMSFTFWSLLGIDFNDPSSMAGGSSYGPFAFLGLIAIAAPFAAPFLRVPWSKYLNVAPFAYVVIAVIMITVQINKAFGDLGGGPSPFSWSWGVYVLGLAALGLGALALKPPAKA
jgi:hypothetical protein